MSKKLLAIILISLAIPIFVQAGIFDWLFKPQTPEQNLGATVLFPSGGGTGFGSYNRGDIIIASSTYSLYKLSTGTEGYVLTISSGIPAWTAGGAAGVSSLNTLSGVLTLWGTSDNLTVTASGTVGLVLNVPNNATTGYTGFTWASSSFAWATSTALNLLNNYYTSSTISTNYVSTTTGLTYLTSALAASTYVPLSATGTWNTAYSWGNHATAGYLTTSSAATNYISTTTGLTYLTSALAAQTYLATGTAASTYVPYTGATGAVNLGSQTITTSGIGTFGSVAIPTLFTNTTEPTGFVDKTATLSFATSTRIFTITGNHDIYINGVKTTKATASTTIADTTGMHWVYYDSVGTLSESTTQPGFDVPLIATVYWNTTIDKALLGEERHGIIMDGATHHLLHNTVGTRYESGLTGTFSNATTSITAGVIDDEDLEHSIGIQTTVDIIYKNGAADFEWITGQTKYYIEDTGSDILYNNGNATGTVGANNYVCYWIFATNATSSPIVSLIGQRTDTTITDARANCKYESLTLGTLPYQEMKLLYRVILRNNATPYEEAQDLRSISNLPAGTFVATQHNALTGLDFDNSGHTGFQASGSYATTGDIGFTWASSSYAWATSTALNLLNNYYTSSTISTNYVSTTTGLTYLLGSASSSFAWRANNLSDLANTSTARTNLGLVIGTNVMAYEANNATTGSSITGFSGTLLYNHGGTGTSTILALQNLWWGDGSGGLVQVASSTLAGAGGGVTSLNTLTGALTLWGTSPLTITASSTEGLLFAYTESDPLWNAASSSFLTITTAASTYVPLSATTSWNNAVTWASSSYAIATSNNAWIEATGTNAFNYATQTAAKIGTLTNLKWCSSDGSKINCTEAAPTSGGGESSWSTSTGLVYMPVGTEVLIGGSATTSGGYAFEVIGNSLIPGYATSGVLVNYPTLTFLGNNYVSTTTGLTYLTSALAAQTYLATGTAASTYFKITEANASSTAWLSDIYWTGISTNLVAATGRTSLGLGDAAVLASSTWIKIETDPIWNAASSSFLTVATAASTYLATGTAVSTYLATGTAVSTYLATGTAASTYALLTNNATTGSSITGFAGYLASSTWAKVANNLSDLANTSTARTNLGLGDAALQASSTFIKYADATSTNLNTLYNWYLASSSNYNLAYTWATSSETWHKLFTASTTNWDTAYGKVNASSSNWDLGYGQRVTGGQTNYLPYFTSATAFSTSTIYFDGTNIGIGTTTPSTVLQVYGTTTTRQLIINSGVSAATATITIGNSGSASSTACIKTLTTDGKGWAWITVSYTSGLIVSTSTSCE